MTFEGTDCSLADVGRLADTTGGRVRHHSHAFCFNVRFCSLNMFVNGMKTET